MTSNWGNKYVLTMYVYDANKILEESVNSGYGSHILEKYTNQAEHLTNRGYRQRVHWLDNES